MCFLSVPAHRSEFSCKVQLIFRLQAEDESGGKKTEHAPRFFASKLNLRSVQLPVSLRAELNETKVWYVVSTSVKRYPAPRRQECHQISKGADGIGPPQHMGRQLTSDTLKKIGWNAIR